MNKIYLASPTKIASPQIIKPIDPQTVVGKSGKPATESSAKNFPFFSQLVKSRAASLNRK